MIKTKQQMMISNKRTKNRKFVLLVLIIFICTVTLIKTMLSKDFYVLQWQRIANRAPLKLEDLPSADGEEFSPPERSIFFHETSSRGNLGPRQACAVESAARAHPEWQINILFTAPVTKKALGEGILALIQTFDNVKLSRIHIKKYAKGTPIESMIAVGSLNKSRYVVSHTSDVLRYLTLYKWGGIYLDLDVVVAKSLESLAKNWAAREDDNTVNSAALAFSKDDIGRTMANATIRNLNETFRGNEWSNNGPGVITRVLKDLCSTGEVKTMSAETCGGFEVFDPKYIYPIPWQRSSDYFKRRELAPSERDAYVYHTWNHLSGNFNIVKDSPYAKLAEKYCPSVYENNVAHFGSKS